MVMTAGEKYNFIVTLFILSFFVDVHLIMGIVL